MEGRHGTIVTSPQSVYAATAILTKKIILAAIVMTVLGGAGLLSYIVLGTAIEPVPPWTTYLLAFAVPFTIGLIGWLTAVKQLKVYAADKTSVSAEFYDNAFVVTKHTSSGQSVSVVEYKNACLLREQKEYILLYLTVVLQVVPIKKTDLSTVEYNTVRQRFRKAADGETLALPPYTEPTETDEPS